MPEPPDFDAIARAFLLTSDRDGPGIAEVAEQLRQVWNARGARDLATIEALEVLPHGDAYVRIIDRAIRSLDR
jgi:hypothetical protein